MIRAEITVAVRLPWHGRLLLTLCRACLWCACRLLSAACSTVRVAM